MSIAEGRSRSCDPLENQRHMVNPGTYSYKDRKAQFAADVRNSKPRIGLIERLDNHNGVFFPMQSDHAYNELEAPITGPSDMNVPYYTDQQQARFNIHNTWLNGNIDQRLYFANAGASPTVRPVQKASLLDRTNLNP